MQLAGKTVPRQACASGCNRPMLCLYRGRGGGGGQVTPLENFPPFIWTRVHCAPSKHAVSWRSFSTSMRVVTQGCCFALQSSAGVGANLPDAEAYASAAGFDFGGGRNSSMEGPRPLLRGGSFSRGFALPMHGPGMLYTLCASFSHMQPVTCTQSPALSLLHSIMCTQSHAYNHMHLLLAVCTQSCVSTINTLKSHVFNHFSTQNFALHHLLVGEGGFKVNQLPASPFEGARHPPAASASNSNDAPSNGPFGSCLANMSHSMDTTNSNSGGLHSGTQGGDRERDRDHPAAFRGLPSSSSQQEINRSPKGRESPFETLRQQQQQQVSGMDFLAPILISDKCHTNII